MALLAGAIVSVRLWRSAVSSAQGAEMLTAPEHPLELSELQRTLPVQQRKMPAAPTPAAQG